MRIKPVRPAQVRLTGGTDCASPEAAYETYAAPHDHHGQPAPATSSAGILHTSVRKAYNSAHVAPLSFRLWNTPSLPVGMNLQPDPERTHTGRSLWCTIALTRRHS